jgi:hypothetical protein
MPNSKQIIVKRKHKKRKLRIKKRNQEQILKNAKKKTIEKLSKEGRLPKIALGRL